MGWRHIVFFNWFHIVCIRAAKAQARLHICAVSTEPKLLVYAIRTEFSCSGSCVFFIKQTEVIGHVGCVSK